MYKILAFFLPLTPLFANFAYVGENTTVSVIDTTTNTIVDTISLGTDVILIAITPNNLYLYVTELNNNSVAVISTTSNTVKTTISLPSGSQPLGVAITPNGKLAYVTNQGNGTVSVISTATNQVIQSISSFAQPWGIAITPNGRFAYVVNLNGGTSPGFVSVIDLKTNTLLPSTIQVDAGPTGITITPNGRFVYVTNENSNTVSVISTATNTLIATIPVGINPFELTSSPDSQFVYVSNNAYTDVSLSSVSVISTATQTVVDTIALPNSGPAALAVTPDGQTLYVTNTQNTTVISTKTNKVIGFIGGSSSSIAITNTLIANLRGQQKINDFGTIYEFFNLIKWQSVPFSDVIGYNVYRNGKQIAHLNSHTLQYCDHNQKRDCPVTYLVAPIEASGKVSTPLSVVVR